MSFSYDPALSTNSDWVRFLIADTTEPALIQDEEISAVLTEEAGTVANAQALKYVAAARILSMLQGRWASAGQGLTSKTVSRLKLEWGIDSDTGEVIDARIDYLLRRAADLCTSMPKFFRTVGRSNIRGFW